MTNYFAFFCIFALKISKNMKKKTIVAVISALLLVSCQESINEKAAREAKLYTQKNCPALLAENIRIDSLAFEPASRTLHYYYTLSGTADTIVPSRQPAMREALLHDLKNTTIMKAYKDEGFNFAYTYRSEKNPEAIILDATFTKDDY